jgi:Zn-dependent peptidase ImmA (M78 family)
MKPLRPRYKRIDQKVAELLHNHGIVEPPVPVDDIARALGAQVVLKNFKDEISGLLMRSGRSIILGVNKSQSLARRRFTIAHEIGHLIMHSAALEPVHIDKNFEVHLRSGASSTAEDVVEVEANAFAAGLLMPRDFIIADVDGQMLDFEDPQLVKRLAESYEVSTQAMTFRLINLFAYRAFAYS